MLLSDDQYRTWKLGNVCECCFSLCVIPINCLCLWPLHLLLNSNHSRLDSWYGNFLAVFPKIPMVWHVLTHTGHDIWHLLHGCMFVFSAAGAGHSSPLYCWPFHIYRYRRRKTNHNLSFHKNYVFVKNVLNSSSCIATIWYCYWSSYLIYFFQAVHSHVW
jgi:hypothetical protein